jgi:hypothetical protein
MRRLVAILIGVLLLAALPAAAQNADPFQEVAPPAPITPGHDPFQMAPADPAPAPKPAPPRPRPAPEPEPVVAAPPPPPPPAPSPPAPSAKCFTFNNKQFCE